MDLNFLPEFGTDGIRGKAGSELNPPLLTQLGYLIGEVLTQEGPILIGNDSRRSNSMIVSALTSGLNSVGKEVWILGLCTTPAVSILINKLKAAGGIMVSASHNPPEDNGIKVFDFNGQKIKSSKQLRITKGLLKDKSKNIFYQEENNYGAHYERNDLLKYYRKQLIESVSGKTLNDVKIVLDLCHGSATAFGEEIFNTLGANLTVINGAPNGNLINVKCGSTNIDSLRKTVLETSSEMGFAFDGDADRMIAIDGSGRVIDGDHVLYLWGTVLKEENSLPDKRLVTTVMSNFGLEKAWTDEGGILDRTAVGDQNVHNAMIAKGATLGGEPSGHILSAFNDFCGDGLLTALQIATICHSKQISLSQWRDQSFSACPQKMINIPLPAKCHSEKLNQSQEIKEVILKAEADIGNNGRVVIRASGTEPLIRVMVEAKEANLANSWSLNIAKVVENNIFNLV